MRAGVRDFLRRPVSTVELRQLLERSTGTVTAEIVTTGAVVSFISNKGGVGKSTLAVNTACGLALRHPERVLLVDASLQMGVAASMLDLQPPTSLTDAVRERQRLDVTLIRQLATPHESGLDLLAAPADAVEAAEVDDELISHVVTLARRAYDYVIVDTFPLFDRVVMAVLDSSDRAYVVLENVVPTLLGAAKLLELLGRIGFPKERQRVVLNRFISLAGNLKPVDVATRLGQPIDHVLPYEKRVIAAANAGQPVTMRSGTFGRFNRALQAMVGEIEQLSGDKRDSAAGTEQERS
jgi:pilus assembly protein CpaE